VTAEDYFYEGILTPTGQMGEILAGEIGGMKLDGKQVALDTHDLSAGVLTAKGQKIDLFGTATSYNPQAGTPMTEVQAQEILKGLQDMTGLSAEIKTDLAAYSMTDDKANNFSALQDLQGRAVGPAVTDLKLFADGQALGSQNLGFSPNTSILSEDGGMVSRDQRNVDYTFAPGTDKSFFALTYDMDSPNVTKGIFRGKDGNLVNEISIDHAGRVTTGGAGVFAGARASSRAAIRTASWRRTRARAEPWS